MPQEALQLEPEADTATLGDVLRRLRTWAAAVVRHFRGMRRDGLHFDFTGGQIRQDGVPVATTAANTFTAAQTVQGPLVLEAGPEPAAVAGHAQIYYDATLNALVAMGPDGDTTALVTFP